jgi:hypothetical protein
MTSITGSVAASADSNAGGKDSHNTSRLACYIRLGIEVCRSRFLHRDRQSGERSFVSNQSISLWLFRLSAEIGAHAFD